MKLFRIVFVVAVLAIEVPANPVLPFISEVNSVIASAPPFSDGGINAALGGLVRPVNNMLKLPKYLDLGAILNEALTLQSFINNIGTALQQALQEKKNGYCAALYTFTGMKTMSRNIRDLSPPVGTPLNEEVEAILNLLQDPNPDINPLIQPLETAQIALNGGPPEAVYVNKNGGIAPDHDDMVKAIEDLGICKSSLGDDFDQHIKVGANPIRIGNDLNDMFGDLLQLTGYLNNEKENLKFSMAKCIVNQMSKNAKMLETYVDDNTENVNKNCIMGLRTFIEYMNEDSDNIVDAHLAEPPLTDMVNGIQTAMRRIRE